MRLEDARYMREDLFDIRVALPPKGSAISLEHELIFSW